MTQEKEGEDFLTVTEVLNFFDLPLVNKMMELLPSILFLKHNIPKNQKVSVQNTQLPESFCFKSSRYFEKKNELQKVLPPHVVNFFHFLGKQTQD